MKLFHDCSCVLEDPEQNIYYDVLMSKVDVKVGKFGLYNFYKMQVGSFVLLELCCLW